MVEKITLDNGVRIVHERLEHLRSCALGLWVESGSRHEPEALCGISHFIEHMMFKGTETRTAAQLAADFDAVGGQVNAFTTKEQTCYYCRTLGEYLPRAAELLCDMYFNSKFDDEAAELERGVICEEIDMYEDTPDDLVNEELFSAIYSGYKLGRPILGTKESLAGIRGSTLKAYVEQNYTPDFAEGRGLGYQMVDAPFSEMHRLFPVGGFGHIGATGQAFFISRERDMYAILLTNLRRHIHHRFDNYNDYKAEHARQRAEIFRAIRDDLLEQALL